MQLLSVIAHSRVTIFTIDTDQKVTMLEGALIWDTTTDDNNHREDRRWYIGENVYQVFNRLTERLGEGEQPKFLQPIEAVLKGADPEHVVAEEHPFSKFTHHDC